MLPPYSMESERSKPLLREGDLWTAEETETLNILLNTRTDKNWYCQSIIVKSWVSSFHPAQYVKGLAVVAENVHSSRSLHSMNAAFRGLAVKWLESVHIFQAVQSNLNAMTGDFWRIRFLLIWFALLYCTSTNKHTVFLPAAHTYSLTSSNLLLQTEDSLRFFVFLLISCDWPALIHLRYREYLFHFVYVCN